jgi:hypothetical protein
MSEVKVLKFCHKMNVQLAQFNNIVTVSARDAVTM